MERFSPGAEVSHGLTLGRLDGSEWIRLNMSDVRGDVEVSRMSFSEMELGSTDDAGDETDFSEDEVDSLTMETSSSVDVVMGGGWTTELSSGMMFRVLATLALGSA